MTGDRNRETETDKRRLTRPRYAGSSTGTAAGRSQLSTGASISQFPFIARFETRSEIRADSDGIVVEFEAMEPSNSTRAPPRVAQRSATEIESQFVRTDDSGSTFHAQFASETRSLASNRWMGDSIPYCENDRSSALCQSR
ncbi:hypothetical protein EL22_01065 [Halostagnicola sp. A56]|nr:hypothetical protein EL22_01065 [Halostagnicola sp. A56]